MSAFPSPSKSPAAIPWSGAICALHRSFVLSFSPRARFDRRALALALVLTDRIHGVREGDGVQVVEFGVLHQRRVDEEHDRHVARLAGLEPLLGEAEAVDLGEIGPGGRRRDVVRRLPNGLACGFVRGREDLALIPDFLPAWLGVAGVVAFGGHGSFGLRKLAPTRP